MGYIISAFYNHTNSSGGPDIPINHTKWVLQNKDFIPNPQDEFLWDNSLMGALWDDNLIWFEG